MACFHLLLPFCLSTLENLINFGGLLLLQGALDNRCFACFRCQFWIIFSSTNQTLSHAWVSWLGVLVEVQKLASILCRLRTDFSLCHLHLLDLVHAYLLTIKAWSNYNRLSLIPKMEIVFMFLDSVLTLVVMITWHRRFQWIFPTVIVWFRWNNLPSNNLILLRKMLALGLISISHFWG